MMVLVKFVEVVGVILASGFSVFSLAFFYPVFYLVSFFLPFFFLLFLLVVARDAFSM